MKTFKNKFKTAKTKACLNSITVCDKVKNKLADSTGDGYIDTAVKIILGVVIGALVLAGLILLWNNVIMPRLNTEVNSMFNA